MRKLVTTFHLNVPERLALNEKAVPGSLITASILTVLHESGAFPPQWKNAAVYEGGLITMGDDGECHVIWMGEVGLGRFEVIERQQMHPETKALSAYAQRLYGREIDGIPIDWSR